MSCTSKAPRRCSKLLLSILAGTAILPMMAASVARIVGT
jgi:hypothetical protein